MVSRYLIVFIAAGSALLAADNKDEKFSPGPASSYPTKQSIEHVTIAAVPYTTDEQARPAFGKTNPYERGILPVLVVFQNDTDKALTLENMEVRYEMPDGRSIRPTPAEDLATLHGVKHPKRVPGSVQLPVPIPTGGGSRRKKDAMGEWEITGREFAVRMIPPHETANGFFYFQSQSLPGSKLYISGIREAATGQELFYYEIGLDAK
ncbi:MAG TPA: hypothetical protein VMJ34_08390 [Bryobacteraceae bacterium]|nr:hypothetical protein [Bryobacteraceae bacterium]